jgi:hypothetical protein
MVDLKLPQPPDRTPAKLTVNVTPELRQALDDYAQVYHATYGLAEAVVDLIPAMLTQFSRKRPRIHEGAYDAEGERRWTPTSACCGRTMAPAASRFA